MLASRLNVSTLAVDGCGQKSADSAHESVFRNPSIDAMTSPSGSSSPGNSMLFEDVSLFGNSMMTTLLVLYIFECIVDSRCI